MLLTTPAVVLHAFPYLESSRILRLATREAGVQSVIAKGARRARGAQRMTLDLFVEGSAQLYLKPGRDLHTLGGFDLTRTRPGLGADLGRFAAAAAAERPPHQEVRSLPRSAAAADRATAAPTKEVRQPLNTAADMAAETPLQEVSMNIPEPVRRLLANTLQ